MKALVIFGATGDLCKKKLIPALYTLHKKNLLPKGLKIMVHPGLNILKRVG